jgi:hypothetical protein
LREIKKDVVHLPENNCKTRYKSALYQKKLVTSELLGIGISKTAAEIAKI